VIKEYNKKHGESMYELNILFSLPQEDRIPKVAERLREWISTDGELLETEKKTEEGSQKGFFWVEKRRFAYPIEKEKVGFYLNVWFKYPKDKVNTLLKSIKLEKGVLRYGVIGEKDIVTYGPLKYARVVKEEGKAVEELKEPKPVVKKEVKEKKVEKKEKPKEEVKKEVKEKSEREIKRKERIKQSKISLDELDKKLDDILNEDLV